MLEKPSHGLFIVGTDTGVGKTHVGCCLARWLVAQGRHIGVYKPAESGFDEAAPETSDAWRLWNAAGRPLDWQQVGPQRFSAPLAPAQAALAEGRQLDEHGLRTGLSAWREVSDTVLVEGAGGLLSPLGRDDLVADLALEFGYPLLIVGDNSIGAINRVLQTLFVAAAYRGGLPVAGIVLNQVDAKVDPSRATNPQEIVRRINVPLVANLGWGDAAAEFDGQALRRWLPS